MEKGTKGQGQLPFVCCKRETETANLQNGKQKPWLADDKQLSTMAVSENMPI
jgi:hypothetical protein